MTAPAAPDAVPTVALDDLGNIVAAYAEFDAKVKQFSEARDGLRRIIETHLADAEVGTIAGRPRVRRSRYTDRRIDTRRLREQAPADLLAACTVESERTRFALVDPGQATG